jgi:nicotinamidase-related amidase
MGAPITIEPHKTAVLIMDYQIRIFNFFAKEIQDDLAFRANKVLSTARQKGIPVIYIEVVRGERTPEHAILAQLTPQPGDIVLTKHRVGPFSTTDLNERLKKLGIETLVLMGVASSGCVLSAVRWAADIDYKLIVLSDCCADRDDEVQRVLMEKIFPGQATVTTSREFMEAAAKG